jgi:molybdate transport system regulatory protein
LKLKARIYCGDEIAMGPGKAELLRQIAETGSISAAAVAMGMSYRRAWTLVDVMNRCFQAPLVEARPGRGTGGARVTAEGEWVLTAYEALVRSVETASEGPPLDLLMNAVRAQPAEKAPS